MNRAEKVMFVSVRVMAVSLDTAVTRRISDECPSPAFGGPRMETTKSPSLAVMLESHLSTFNTGDTLWVSLDAEKHRISHVDLMVALSRLLA